MEVKLILEGKVNSTRDALIALGDTISRLSPCKLLFKKLDLLDQIAGQEIALSSETKALYIDVVETIFSSLKAQELTIEQIASEIFCLLKAPVQKQELSEIKQTIMPLVQTHKLVTAATTNSLQSSGSRFSYRRSLKKKGQVPLEELGQGPSINEILQQLKKLVVALVADPSLKEFSTGICRDNFIKMALSYINIKSCHQDKRATYMDLQKILEENFSSHDISPATCNEIIGLLDKQLSLDMQTLRRSSSHF